MFACAGLGGEDALYASFAGKLRGGLVVTGFHGDKVWDLHAQPNDLLKRGDLSGASLGEFRLQSDFVHVPIPFIGGRRHPEIAAIARSAEMRPFSVGGAYDRPIARRIAEEAGVLRETFGVNKRAVSLRRAGNLRDAPWRVRVRYHSGVIVWRLLHGGARRLPLWLRARALAAADQIFPTLFGKSFAVFEHGGAHAERPFLSALAARASVYRRQRASADETGESVVAAGS
jgi:hypothetical protein